MTSHVITSCDSHHRIYNQRNYLQTTYSTNPLYHPRITTLPIPSIDFCENLLYENQNSTPTPPPPPSSSLFINNINEHYDNAFMHTYDNPIEYHERYIIKQSLINIPDPNENLYDNTKIEDVNNNEKSSNKSSILCYLENKRLAFYACLTSLILLLTIAIGIFLLNKYIRPIVIHTTVNHHYDMMNISNITIPVTTTTVALGHLPFPYSICPPDRWGIGCQNICKPCGLGVCHSITGKCICPVDIYGEFCDLWKVNDTPKRGDMTN